jgi:hypothetical protein
MARSSPSERRILNVSEFSSDKQALDFIAGKIADKAKQDGSPLSDVERKMLYFSETDWTLPDMAEVSAEFDRDYDQDEYERKIAALIGKITTHHHGNNFNEEENWDDAIARLSEGDHSILVLVKLGRSDGSGFLPTFDPPAVRPPHDRLKLLLTATAVVIGIAVFGALGNWLFGPKFWTVTGWVLGNRFRFEGIVLTAVLIWVFRGKLKSALKTLLGRE